MLLDITSLLSMMFVLTFFAASDVFCPLPHCSLKNWLVFFIARCHLRFAFTFRSHTFRVVCIVVTVKPLAWYRSFNCSYLVVPDWLHFAYTLRYDIFAALSASFASDELGDISFREGVIFPLGWYSRGKIGSFVIFLLWTRCILRAVSDASLIFSSFITYTCC